MVLRLKLNKTNKDNKIFLYREWLPVAIICTLIIVGNLYRSAPVLIAATAMITIAILRSDIADAFYWALFLVPNIRMLDLLGVEYLVNVMMALPLVVYFLKRGIHKVSAVALVGGMVLLAMELLHDAVLNDMRNLINIGGWVLNFVLCVLLTTDSTVELSKDDVFSALSTGVIMSAAMFFFSGEESVMHIMETLEEDTRLQAFAGDPNAYSLYTTLAIACVLSVRGRDIYKFINLALLVGIGLMTASKMGLITITIELFLIFIQAFNRNKENKAVRKFAGWALAGVVGLAVAFRDYLAIVIRNFFRRSGADELQSIDLNKFTTGRSGIILEYLGILGRDLVCLLFGYGFNYHQFAGQSRGAQAHNTYMDLLLSWGLIGTAIFLFILCLWIKDFLRVRQIRRISIAQHIPLITLLITFMALSCLSASMFPFVLAVAFIQWIPGFEKRETV